MGVPKDHSLLLNGNANYMREVSRVFKDAGIRAVTGPLPGTS